jgi:hypothetical protein
MENPVEMYQQDIEELDKFIQQSNRPNIKRFLEEHKKNLTLLLEQEKKNFNQANTSSTSLQQETQSQPFVSVSKYALDSGDKFAK